MSLHYGCCCPECTSVAIKEMMWVIQPRVARVVKDAGSAGKSRPGERISAPEREIYCHYCNQMIPENKYFHHMGKCCPDSEFKKHFPVGKPKILPSSLPSQAAENQTSTMEKDVRPKTRSINRFPLHSESSSKKAPRSKNKTLDPLLMSEPKPRTSSPRGDKAAYDILRTCSQCGILLPLPILNQHQEKCWWLASSKGKQVRNFS
nr:XIAP-associated factor 1 isoform X7 [Gorilla gorilla gorilla]